MTYYLYIKTHNNTGMKYLGQTQKDPFKYKGSGKYWKRHIKTHGNNVTTQILLATESISELKQTGMFFSSLFNIVKSDEWANLTEETGNGISPEFSSKLQKERIQRGEMTWLFTSEGTREFNYKRVKDGTHPFLNNTRVKIHNDTMLREGTHPFKDKQKMEYNRRVVKETQLRLSGEGRHNFKNKVPVVDKQGNNLIISRDEYIQQKSVYQNIEDYPYVSNKSNEAKKRKSPWLYHELVTP